MAVGKDKSSGYALISRTVPLAVADPAEGLNLRQAL